MASTSSMRRGAARDAWPDLAKAFRFIRRPIRVRSYSCSVARQNSGVSVAFVHGCTQGPSGWDRVRERLELKGTRTAAVDLDPDAFRDASALECASHIAEQTSADDRLVLVGTSCSGILTPVVTLLRPVERLVFICAGLPDIGRSVTNQIEEDGVLHEDWRHSTAPPDSEDAAARFMFNDCAGEVLAWSLTTVRLFLPGAAFREVTPIKAWPTTPTTYILGTKDRIISQAWARRAVPERLGSVPIELPTGHCPQNSNPELLARTLLAELANPSRATRSPDGWGTV